MMGERITLTYTQLVMAATVGVMRRVNALKGDHAQRNGAPDAPWETDIVAAMAEYAAAIQTNCCWRGPMFFGKPQRDVGGLFDVRAITDRHHRLRLHSDDDDDTPQVLVFCDPPHFEIMGWLFAREGKLPRYLCDPTGKGRPPAFFVPQDHPLRPASELMQWLDGKT